MSAESVLWELRKDEIILGILTVRDYDSPWLICHFEPTSDFERYRPIFDEEWNLEPDDSSSEEWDAWYQAVVELGLTLVAVREKQSAKEFILHIAVNEASFRAIF